MSGGTGAKQGEKITSSAEGVADRVWVLPPLPPLTPHMLLSLSLRALWVLVGTEENLGTLATL